MSILCYRHSILFRLGKAKLREPTTLSDEDALTLADWVTTKSIVIDHKIANENGRLPFFAPDQRKCFMDALIPPERVSIWIAQLGRG